MFRKNLLESLYNTYIKWTHVILGLNQYRVQTIKTEHRFPAQMSMGSK